MTADHAARAVELAEQATRGINANHSTPGASGRQTLAIAGVAEAILALAEATAGVTEAFKALPPTAQSAVLAAGVQRPRWDDDLRCSCTSPRYDGDDGYNRDCLEHGAAACDVIDDDDPTPDHPEIVTERGQERPGESETVVGTTAPTPEPEQAHSAFDWTWEPICSGCGYLKAQDPATGAWIHKATGKARCDAERASAPVDDPTHTDPITVHGIPAEDHHAHVCPVCRRVREEKP